MPHMVTFDGLNFSGINRANPNDSPGPAPDRLGRNAPANSVSDQVAQFRTEIQDFEALEAPIGQVEPTQFSTTAKAIVHPQYQPEADGFMKLDDIKGEFSPSSESLGGSSYSPWDHEVINASDFAQATKDVGWWTVDGADFRGIQQDALTKGGQEGEEAAVNDAPPVFKSRSNWDVICDVGTSIKQDGIDLQSDALVQQVNDFAGLISPDQMRPVDFANNPVMFETGLPVEGIGASNTTGTEANQMIGPIGHSDVFTGTDVIVRQREQAFI